MRKLNKNFAGKLASWFLVGAMMVTLAGCGKDVPATPDTTPDTPVVEADVDVDTDTNVDVEPNVDTDVDVDANVDVETDVEPVAEPVQVIYEGLTPGGTGYYAIKSWDGVNGDVYHGLCAIFVPIDKNEHAAIAYVGDLIEDGGDYYAAKKSSLDEDADINLYTRSIENCKYAVYFEAPSVFKPTLSRINDEAIGGCDIRLANSGFADADTITINAYAMDVAKDTLDWYESYNTPKDYYVEKGYEDVREYLYEREDGRLSSIVSYLTKNADHRRFYANFISLDESKSVNLYEVQFDVSLDFSEEEAIAIINSVRFMEKDEADELYMSLLHQTEANEYFDPATIE